MSEDLAVWKADKDITCTGTRAIRDSSGIVVCWVPQKSKNLNILVNAREILELLEWYVANDSTPETADNAFWLEVRDKAKELIDRSRRIKVY